MEQIPDPQPASRSLKGRVAIVTGAGLAPMASAMAAPLPFCWRAMAPA
jgi:hypothetical protein